MPRAAAPRGRGMTPRRRRVLAGAALLAAALVARKLLEPGGGVLVLLGALAARAAPACEPSPFAANVSGGGPPARLSVCHTFGEDAARMLPEWIAFHRMQGVARFDLAWDVVQPLDVAAHAAFLRETAAFVRAGAVHTLTKADLAPLVAALAAATRAARAASPRACGASEGDLAETARRLDVCLTAEARGLSPWHCQDALHAVCLVAAKLRGDTWLGLFDADEFIFAPGRRGAEDACFWGGRPRGEEAGTARARALDAARSGDEAAAADCVLPLSEAPLLTGRDLPTVLDSYGAWTAAVHVQGATFGLVAGGRDRPRGTLLVDAHRRSAAYDGRGALVLPPRVPRPCPEWFCRVTQPQKGFVFVAAARVAGLRIHEHAVGALRWNARAPGAALKMNHYAYDDVASVRAKGASRDAYLPVADNAGGLADFLSSWPDESGAAYLPLLRACIDAGPEAAGPECAPGRPDGRAAAPSRALTTAVIDAGSHDVLST